MVLVFLEKAEREGDRGGFKNPVLKIHSPIYSQTKPSRGEETVDMRGGKGTKGGDPPEESRERGAYRGEEEEREVAHRVRFWKLDTEDVGAGRHRWFHFLGYPSSNVHHQCHDVLRRSTVDQEVF